MDSHTCEVETKVRSFNTKHHRVFTAKSIRPSLMNRITFKFTCKTIARDMVSNEYSSYVLEQHPREVTKTTFHHNLARQTPNFRTMYEAIHAELRHWSLPESDCEEAIEKVVAHTRSAIFKASPDDNNFIVTVKIHHRHDRLFFENAPQMVPATDESIKNLEREVVSECKGNCSVCMEEMSIGCEAAKMPCCHAFHGDCIETWLRISRYCPLCRYEMPHD